MIFKITKKKKIALMHDRALNLFRDICFSRDGRQCQVLKNYPMLKVKHSDTLQVDHCISRGNKNEFYNYKNGTVVCSNCNLAKHHHLKSVTRAIDFIVQKREGFDVWMEMVMGDMQSTGNDLFNDIAWLDGRLRILTIIKNNISEIKSGKIPND